MRLEETFKVELEVKVEYDVPEGVTRPYTHFMGELKKNTVRVATTKGNIVDFEMVKAEVKR